MWERDMCINEVREIRVKTTAYLGVGAIDKFADIAANLKQRGIDKLIVVSSRSAYKKTGAWAKMEPILKEAGIGYVIYDQVMPNPDDKAVNEATKMAFDFGAKAVVGIGGGSPIDAAKSVAILLEYPGKTAEDLYEYRFTPERAVPVIAVNLTHGTGTEVNRFAVVSIPSKDYKPAIAYDFIYPLFSIDDPALMTTLPPFQTSCVSVDAINHVFEACTTVTANPLSCMLAKETVRLVYDYLPKALKNPEDLEARYYLTFAAMMAGTSFDNGLLHFTHALEHPLSAVKVDLTHGLGLAILLPAVLKQIYEARKATILDVMAPILGEGADKLTADEAAARIREWLRSVGIKETLKDMGFGEGDLEKLTDLAFTTPSLKGLLDCAPVEATRERVYQIYKDSL